MVITQPTVDDFSDTTVMRVIRKIVNYICNNLVDGINNNDIVSGQFSVQGNQLSGTLTKGDGTTIDIPAATLPSGGGGSDNPYPTAVSMTLSGTTLNFNMTMSSGIPITGTVDLSAFLTKSEANTTYATKTEVTAIGVTSEGNNVSVNGKTATIVKSVSGQVTDGNLKITVNGVASSPITLPASGGKQIIDFDNRENFINNVLPVIEKGDILLIDEITINSDSGSQSIFNGNFIVNDDQASPTANVFQLYGYTMVSIENGNRYTFTTIPIALYKNTKIIYAYYSSSLPTNNRYSSMLTFSGNSDYVVFKGTLIKY